MSRRSASDSALDLISHGLSPIPVLFKSKAAVLDGWPELRVDASNVAEHFNGLASNVGVLWGDASGGIVDVDVDDDLALQLADSFLPVTDAIFGRASRPRSHRLFRLSRPANTQRWKTSAGEMIVELRSTGSQTIAPGSIHPSGEAIRWDTDGEPTLIDPDVLIAAIDALVEATKRELDPCYTDTDDPMILRPDDPIDPVRCMRPAQVVQRAAVTGSRQHDAQTHRLARGLKLNCGLSLDKAMPYFDRWWMAAQPHCSNDDPDAARFKFERAFETADVPLDAPGVAARVLARLEALSPVPEEAAFGPKLGALVRALAEMGRLSGDRHFALSARMVADAFGVGVATAHEWLCGLERRRLLECTDRGRSGTGGKGRARRLRWLGKATCSTKDDSR